MAARSPISNGLVEPGLDVLVFARGASFNKHDVCEFDLAQASATSTIPGLTTSVFANIVAPTTDGAKAGIHCVLLEDIAQDDRGWVRIIGVIHANTKKSSGSANINAGAGLVVATDGTLDNVFAADQKYVAEALGTIEGATPIAATPLPVRFNGLPGGLGTYVTGTGGGAVE